jgi:glutamine amidotransferase
MIGIIDYGMGNLLSVQNALVHLGYDPVLCAQPEQLTACDRLILPGVGAFGDCLANLRKSGLVDALEEEVKRKAKPLLGICLGMQALAEKGSEGGSFTGLGFIPGEVVRLDPGDENLRIPHVGWNNVKFTKDHPIWRGIPQSVEFYFVHSYWFRCSPENLLASAPYGGQITAAVARENIVATQFHPEKSQGYGLTLLENFLRWKP